MLRGSVPAGLAAGTILATLAVAAGVEWRAVYALDHPAPRRLDAAYCASCHKGAAGMALLKWKERNTHFLFASKPVSGAECPAVRQVAGRPMSHSFR